MVFTVKLAWHFHIVLADVFFRAKVALHYSREYAEAFITKLDRIQANVVSFKLA